MDKDEAPSFAVASITYKSSDNPTSKKLGKVLFTGEIIILTKTFVGKTEYIFLCDCTIKNLSDVYADILFQIQIKIVI